ncbi:MFS general substrate transporter [Epithele typhae]|uniref:MFS general substrate transporter n=1 Tax=Epithele typhae TaxID=378194 RepID=UPI0020087113|nr:MFS general substrate transporter [Epithele typhae]KAH9933637.1 MFS general substrate transporter [Epithele typhae]
MTHSDMIKGVEYRTEDVEKDIASVSSGGAFRLFVCITLPGIDGEVADFFAAQGHSVGAPVEIDEATDRRLRWMIHKRVLVVMVVTYFAQTLDKGTLNFASIMGIIEDTHLVGQQYSWLTTCVYLAILIWEFPTNRLIQRLPIGKYLAFCIACWGIVLACTAACHNFTGLVIVRTLLGVFECVCQPAFVFLSTMWYKREEQALVIGAFYSMNGLQQCVGGLIAYGVAHFESPHIKNWQFLFTVLGVLTFLWGLFVAYWLPDSPMRATCFSPEDRVLMAERVRENETGIQNKEFKWYQVREAMTDPTVIGVTVVSFTNGLPPGGLGAFSNIIITAFGYTRLQTYLLAIAQGAIIMAFLFSGAWLSKRYNQKILLAIIYSIPSVVGTIVFLTVPTRHDTKVGLLISFYLTMAFSAVAVLNLAVMSNNVAGRTKQVVASTLVFIAWAVGNAIGPQVFRADDGPRYVKAFVAHIVVYAVQIAVLFFLRVHLMRMNALKRRAARPQGEHVAHSHAFDDLTDRENPDFRYTY